jgi:hypothetical protein
MLRDGSKFVLLGYGNITRKNMTETFHHALCEMIPFPVIWGGGGDTPSSNKKINLFHKSFVYYENPWPCF